MPRAAPAGAGSKANRQQRTSASPAIRTVILRAISGTPIRKPVSVVHLDEIERIPGPNTLTWLPVRATLGVRAFGCNAYVAGEAGDDVVEPHTEEGAGHEEMYFVARGRAEFTVDGERIDAPAGTYVFIPDPESHRHAVAAEAGTTVLSFGGPPTFEPSEWEGRWLREKRG
jgi:quercetin dioxygenase-like cupin family protein